MPFDDERPAIELLYPYVLTIFDPHPDPDCPAIVSRKYWMNFQDSLSLDAPWRKVPKALKKYSAIKIGWSGEEYQVRFKREEDMAMFLLRFS
jgi:hypothetical protein